MILVRKLQTEEQILKPERINEVCRGFIKAKILLKNDRMLDEVKKIIKYTTTLKMKAELTELLVMGEEI